MRNTLLEVSVIKSRSKIESIRLAIEVTSSATFHVRRVSGCQLEQLTGISSRKDDRLFWPFANRELINVRLGIVVNQQPSRIFRCLGRGKAALLLDPESAERSRNRAGRSGLDPGGLCVDC